MTPDDGILVLLPGSEETPDGVQLLTELTVLDAYMARSRLRTRLPVVLCPIGRQEAERDLGDRLDAAGIRFVAVSRTYLEAPYAPVAVVRIHPGTGTVGLVDPDDREFPIDANGRVHLQVARYQVDARRPASSRSSESDRLMEALLAESSDVSAVSGSLQALFVYPPDGVPVFEIREAHLDYTFLGARMGLTTLENFKQLCAWVAQTFGQPVNTDMITHPYAIEQATDYPEGAGKSGWWRPGKSEPRMRSNASGIHRMSRLLFCGWLRDNQWVGRFYAGPVSRTDPTPPAGPIRDVD